MRSKGRITEKERGSLGEGRRNKIDFFPSATGFQALKPRRQNLLSAKVRKADAMEFFSPLLIKPSFPNTVNDVVGELFEY
jgi:hypothetical protein